MNNELSIISDFLNIKREFFKRKAKSAPKVTAKKNRNELMRVGVGSSLKKKQISYVGVAGNCTGCDLLHVTTRGKHCTIPKGMICDKGTCFIYQSKLV
jgi:hypothetical protein